MKERGIIYSAPMVRAILADAKTQTRRLVGLDTLQRSTTPGYDWTWRGQAPIRSIAQQRNHPAGCWQDVTADRMLSLCPYGVPGDRLWVRETWAPMSEHLEDDGRALEDARAQMPWAGVVYGADRAWLKETPSRWRSPIHMPRWASRITLDVTSVRVQRLTDITEDEAAAEGVERGECTHPDCSPGSCASSRYRPAFALLWDSINGQRAPSAAWACNPWVWVITFRRLP